MERIARTNEKGNAQTILAEKPLTNSHLIHPRAYVGMNVCEDMNCFEVTHVTGHWLAQLSTVSYLE